MHYFVDGYNLLFRVVRSDEDLQKQREALLKELTFQLEYLAINATIVFDAAYSPGGMTRVYGSHADVVFTNTGESADNFILEELRGILCPHQQTVVTSDKRLAWRARRLGAKTQDVATFFTGLAARYRNKVRKSQLSLAKPVSVAKVRVPPPKLEVPPESTETPEACYEYYRYLFEQRLSELPPETKKSRPLNEPMSDLERYLQLFSKRLENENDTD